MTVAEVADKILDRFAKNTDQIKSDALAVELNIEESSIEEALILIDDLEQNFIFMKPTGEGPYILLGHDDKDSDIIKFLKKGGFVKQERDFLYSTQLQQQKFDLEMEHLRLSIEQAKKAMEDADKALKQSKDAHRLSKITLAISIIVAIISIILPIILKILGISK